MLVLRPPCSVRADHIGNYLGMRLDKEDKPERISGDLPADAMRIILEKMSDMRVGKFGVFKQPTATA